MQDKLTDITIALAGMLQSVALLAELTQTGQLQPEAYHTSIDSIFRVDVDSVPDVFGGLPGVKLGLQKIVQAFDGNKPTDRLQNRYLLSLIHLQKKLSRSPKTLTILMQRLAQIQKQVDYFSLTHPTVIASLADAYLTAINQFHFRVVIIGSQRVLHVKENMEKVRALLLAGVRAAVLWRQVGGSRLQILFGRAKMKACAERLLLQFNTNDSVVLEKDPA